MEFATVAEAVDKLALKECRLSESPSTSQLNQFRRSEKAGKSSDPAKKMKFRGI